MKIKSNTKLHNLRKEKIVDYIKRAPWLAFFMTTLLVTAFSFVLILYGASLQKNQTAATMQQIIYNAAHTRFSVFSNYILGLTSSPDRLYIDVKFKDMQLLDYAREAALSRGIITNKDQKSSIKAKLTIGSDNFKIKMSPTGQNLDMIGNYNKRAYKVKVLNGKKIYGMKEFKLVPPNSRNNLVEWVGHALEKREGLISLRYFFVEVTLNGNNLGVYGIEENFSKELLENRKAREGIIFSGRSYENIRIFNKKELNKNNVNRNRIRLLKTALQGVKTNDITVDRLFDLEKFAAHFAIIDLMNGDHPLIDFNAFNYFNPITNLIEPIAREYNSLRYSDGMPPNNKLVIEHADTIIKGTIRYKMFQNQIFIAKYLNYLLKLSDVKYLDSFFADVDTAMNEQKHIIYRDDPFYDFPKEYLYERQKQILNKLDQNLKISSHAKEDEKGYFDFQFKNDSPYPVTLNNIYSSSGILKLFKNTVISPGDYLNISLELVDNISINDLNFNYSIFGINDRERSAVIIPKSFITGIILPELWDTSYKYLLNNNDIHIDRDSKSIKFQKNIIQIEENLYIPEDFVLTGKAGLKLDLLNGASIFSKSALNFRGSKDNPIIITSSDNSGGGLVIHNSRSKSIFINTIFNNLSSPNVGRSGLTGSITINNGEVSFYNCTFINNKSEDFLNLIHTKYRIVGSEFSLVQSDAVDSDYSLGSIENSTFADVGNDAMDFSGSKAEISDIAMDRVGDKGISAGEKSKVTGIRINILNTEIGITSKDLSEVELTGVQIKDTRLGIAAFQKKPEFGASKIKITDLKMENVYLDHLIGPNSTAILNGKSVILKESQVENFLYGVEYGKSSK